MNDELAVQGNETPSTKQEGLSECEHCVMLQVQRFLEGWGCSVDFVHENVLSIDEGLWHITVERADGELWLDFHVNIDPCTSARIASKVAELASMIGMRVRVGESYAFEFDENGEFVGVTFGDEAKDNVPIDPPEISG